MALKLKASLGKQQVVFQKAVTTSDETVRASFIVSERIAKSSNQFPEGIILKKHTARSCWLLSQHTRYLRKKNISLTHLLR